MTDPDSEAIGGWRFVELLWPFNDMFRARLATIRGVPYDAAFEAEADAAIRALPDAPAGTAWNSLSPGAWRVLLERHQQASAFALASQTRGEPFIVIPRGLSEDDQRVALVLLVLLEMKLPLPPADRSSLEFHEGPLPPTMRGH